MWKKSGQSSHISESQGNKNLHLAVGGFFFIHLHKFNIFSCSSTSPAFSRLPAKTT